MPPPCIAGVTVQYAIPPVGSRRQAFLLRPFCCVGIFGFLLEAVVVHDTRSNDGSSHGHRSKFSPGIRFGPAHQSVAQVSHYVDAPVLEEAADLWPENASTKRPWQVDRVAIGMNYGRSPTTGLVHTSGLLSTQSPLTGTPVTKTTGRGRIRYTGCICAGPPAA